MSTVTEPTYRQRIGYHSGLLGGFATFAAALLILGYNSTHEPIAARHAEDLLESLSQVMPASLHDNNLLDDAILIEDNNGRPLTVYRAMKQHRVTGLAYRATARGYAGDIELMLGIKPDGELIGVRVLAHAETPGLGDKIEIEKDSWILGFNGRSLRNTPETGWRVKKDGGRFDQFSGATITPRGVVRAVHEGLMFFKAHQHELVGLTRISHRTSAAAADEPASAVRTRCSRLDVVSATPAPSCAACALHLQPPRRPPDDPR